MTTMRVVGECFFWYRLTRVFPDKFHRAVKRLCVCVLEIDEPFSQLLLGFENPTQVFLLREMVYFKNLMSNIGYIFAHGNPPS